MNLLFWVAALLTLAAAAGVAFGLPPRRTVWGFGAASLGLAGVYLTLGATSLAGIRLGTAAFVLAARAAAPDDPQESACSTRRLGAGSVALLALGLFAGGVYPLVSPGYRPFVTALPHYLLLAAALFCLGLYGALAHRPALPALLSAALMLGGAELNLAAFAWRLDPPRGGRVFALLAAGLTAVAAVAAAWWDGSRSSGVRPKRAG